MVKYTAADFVTNFEHTKHANREPQNHWSYILPLQLTGTAQQIFNTEVSLDIMENYVK